MSSDSQDNTSPPRKPRSDAQRNRDNIVQIAKLAFTESGAGASLDEIAKRAGVGPGTLYRHFPSREDLLGAVYSAEVDKLALAAAQLSHDLAPIDALRAWLHLFVDHLATKKIIAAALNNSTGSSPVFEQNMAKVHGAVSLLFGKAIEAGEIRSDVNPADHMRAIVGATFFGTSDDWRDSALRLIEILLIGSRPGGA